MVAGFLDAGQWRARFISVPEPVEPQRPVLLRRESAVRAGLRSAMLYATARGVYQVHVNGVEVDDEVLKPGWTAYRHDARLARPGWAAAAYADAGWLDAREQDGQAPVAPEARRAPAVRRQRGAAGAGSGRPH